VADPLVETITPDDSLYRRISASGHVAPDGKTVTFGAFLKFDPVTRKNVPDEQCSVDLARMTTPEATAARGGPQWGVAQLAASVPLDMGLAVQHDPMADNPAHAEIRGLKTRPECIKLAEACVVVLPPRAKPRPGF
jgi:hypothetical protein